MSVYTIVFEAGLAVLMTVLIIYRIILNKRLAAIRSQDADLKEMTASFDAASQRAEASVSRLKSAGLAAESSLRAAIAEAEGVRASINVSAPAFFSPDDNSEPLSQESAARQDSFHREFDVSRMGGDDVAELTDQPPVEVQSEDRKQAELAVLDAIRLARTEA
ncbi:MAG: hypothetical protein GKS01_06125 [Alphaproteobacteria bacterium]|nr:hypothetical protein [Alphaproteobacteria bacterium]